MPCQCLVRQGAFRTRQAEAAIAIEPELAEAWHYKGVAFVELNRTKEALAAFEHIIEIDSEYVIAWTNKGFALKEMGCVERALVAYEHAIELDPEYAIAWNEKGACSMSWAERKKRKQLLKRQRVLGTPSSTPTRKQKRGKGRQAAA